MEDGYFSLVPGETKRITIQFDPADAGSKTPKLVTECWNNATKSQPPPPQRDKGDLAFGKPVTASSSNDMVGNPSDVVNGNTQLRWASAGDADPQWICVDLGQSEAIGRVKLAWQRAHATSYQVQVSDDAVHWTDIYTTATGAGGTQDLTGLTAQGRYVRVYATQRATKDGYSLSSFEVFGPTVAAAK